MGRKSVTGESQARRVRLRLRVGLWAIAILVLTFGIVTAALFVKERPGNALERGQRGSTSCVRGSTEGAHRRCVR